MCWFLFSRFQIHVTSASEFRRSVTASWPVPVKKKHQVGAWLNFHSVCISVFHFFWLYSVIHLCVKISLNCFPGTMEPACHVNWSMDGIMSSGAAFIALVRVLGHGRIVNSATGLVYRYQVIWSFPSWVNASEWIVFSWVMSVHLTAGFGIHLYSCRLLHLVYGLLVVVRRWLLVLFGSYTNSTSKCKQTKIHICY